jgi:ferredoxin
MHANAGFQMLRNAGFVMQATLPVAALPAWAVGPMSAAGVQIDDFSNLVLLGQAGTRLWDYIQGTDSDSDHPFDEVSQRLAQRFVDDYLGASNWQVVYPGPALLPLGRLAELAGWGKASPLGLTINDEYGLWLAHRVAFLVDAPLPATEPAAFPHPCDSCIGQPCIGACPVGAIDARAGFDIATCSEFRVRADSICAYQCLARLACPVGAGYRYGPAQMTHHYASGLASIRRYFESS